MFRTLCIFVAIGSLSACAQQAIVRPTPPDVLLLGEQHDAPEHQHWQRDQVMQSARQGQLAAVVLEMAQHARLATHRQCIRSAAGIGLE